MPLVSGALDVLLGLICLAIACAAYRRGNDFLFAGFLSVAFAAVVGGFKFGGMTQLDPVHRWFTAVSSGTGSCLMGLGVLSALYDLWRLGRWGAVLLVLLGTAVVHLLWDQAALGTVNLGLGLVLVFSLVILILYWLRRGDLGFSFLTAVSLASLLFMAFGVGVLGLSDEGMFRRVDAVHLLLMISYSCLWLSIRGAGSSKQWTR